MEILIVILLIVIVVALIFGPEAAAGLIDWGCSVVLSLLALALILAVVLVVGFVALLIAA